MRVPCGAILCSDRQRRRGDQTDESIEAPGAADGGAPPAYYHVGLDLRGRACLVVGGGAVARRKAGGLLDAGAAVTVVAPECVPMPGAVTVRLRPFADGDLAGIALAVAASDDRELNARVARLARALGVWVNVADDPRAGSVILPALARRGALAIAVSTGGASPALAQRLRDRIAAEIGADYGELVALLGELRAAWEPRAIAAGVPPAARRAAWHAVLDLPLTKLLGDGRGADAEARARAVLESALGGAGR
jgi:siroheme synthase-like protein